MEVDGSTSGQGWPDVPGVEFRFVPGFPYYCVSSDGHVWSRADKFGGTKVAWARIYESETNEYGHSIVQLSRSGKYIWVGLHRLVLRCFKGEAPEPGMQCCHNDGNPRNNHIDNLRWDTQAGNELDKIEHGTRLCGSRIGNSKLKEADVLAIRERYSDGETQKQLAIEFGVTVTMISYIVRRLWWKHLP